MFDSLRTLHIGKNISNIVVSQFTTHLIKCGGRRDWELDDKNNNELEIDADTMRELLPKWDLSLSCGNKKDSKELELELELKYWIVIIKHAFEYSAQNNPMFCF